MSGWEFPWNNWSWYRNLPWQAQRQRERERLAKSRRIYLYGQRPGEPHPTGRPIRFLNDVPKKYDTRPGPLVGPRPMPLTGRISRVSKDPYLKLVPPHLRPPPPAPYAETVTDYSEPGPAVDRSIIAPEMRVRFMNIGEETRRVLPGVLQRLGKSADAAFCEERELRETKRLDPTATPFTRAATIRVVDMDTLDAALSLGAHPPVARSLAGEINWNPLILNFGDAHRPGHRPGDGWRNGDFTQSESLCYRTSLATSLEKARWPLPYFSAIYSPYVVVIRGPWETGDELLDIDSPHTLPVVSAITASMIWQPEKRSFNIPSGPDFRKKWIFRWDGDRHATKDRMRLVLRLSAYHRHPRIVLGAIGCGINTYQNPAEDMAHCWLEVLREDEFSSACWWTDVVFAVLDKPGTRAEDSNYRIFKRVLHGQMVGGCDWLHDD